MQVLNYFDVFSLHFAEKAVEHPAAVEGEAVVLVEEAAAFLVGLAAGVEHGISGRLGDDGGFGVRRRGVYRAVSFFMVFIRLDAPDPNFVDGIEFVDELSDFEREAVERSWRIGWRRD